MSMDRTEQLRHWLALLRAPQVGPATFHTLLNYFDTPAGVFQASRTTLKASGLRRATLEYLLAPDWPAVTSDLRWLQQEDAHIVLFCDADYPPLLKEISDPPPLLFVKGDLGLLADPQLAVVGSRNPTPAGRETALAFSRALSGSGLHITSGLALGIDAASHSGALAGAGRTIAVTGCGLDQVYPARHKALAQQIRERGALVSEFPPGTPPLAANFPRRNRIISGLSLGVLVVEAALRSGSLITAQQALEQGREVFAIPGSIHSPLARGCHALIRQGAKLVDTIRDILDELGPLSSLCSPAVRAAGGSVAVAGTEDLDSGYRLLLENIGYDPAPVDVVVTRSGLTAEAVCSMLLVLELRGYIQSTPGGLYCQTGKEVIK